MSLAMYCFALYTIYCIIFFFLILISNISMYKLVSPFDSALKALGIGRVGAAWNKRVEAFHFRL